MQRAALLVDAPREPKRLRVYTGRAVWRLVRPGSTPVEAASLRVEADVDIPEAGLRVEIVFDKNTSPQLPAAYTAEVRFIRQPNSPTGEIDRIGLPEMRDEDEPTGDQLAGSQTKVTDDLFLVGLSNADHEAGNLRLLRSRHWIDLPILLQAHREAKMTIEKGTAGEAVWDEALAAWGGKPARISPHDPRKVSKSHRSGATPNPDQLQQAKRPDAPAPADTADPQREARDVATQGTGIVGQLETERAHD